MMEQEPKLDPSTITDVETGKLALRWAVEKIHTLQEELGPLAREKGIQEVRTWEFYTVARREDGQDSLFSNIKAVDNGYPLYGKVELLSGQELATTLQPGQAVVAPALLQRLGLAVGDRILLGNSSFVIVDVISGESLRPVDFFNFGPRSKRCH